MNDEQKARAWILKNYVDSRHIERYNSRRCQDVVPLAARSLPSSALGIGRPAPDAIDGVKKIRSHGLARINTDARMTKRDSSVLIRVDPWLHALFQIFRGVGKLGSQVGDERRSYVPGRKHGRRKARL